MTDWVLDGVGYFGSLIVALSLMMANVKKLRIINLLGAAIFACYGLLIGAWPVFVLNSWIVLVNLYYLVKMSKTREKFDLIDVSGGMNDPVVNLFMDHYRADIIKFYPDLNELDLTESSVWLTYRDLRPSGIFVFHKKITDPNTTYIDLDYAAPEFRDFKNGELILARQVEKLKGAGTHRLLTSSYVKSHREYLLQLGFVPLGKEHELQRVISAKSR